MLMSPVRRHQTGMTLIELMIAILLGIFVIGATITLLVTTVRSSSENVKMLRLNQQLRGALSLMADELDRTGYSADPSVADFMKKLSYDSSNHCLRYAYDKNSNGVLDTSSEVMAFQLNNSEIEWGTGDISTTCTGGTWNPITDPNVAKITAFTVDPSNSVSTAEVTINQLKISITGSISKPAASRTITEIVRIKNEEPM